MFSEVTCSNARVIFVLDSSASVGLLNWYKLLQTTIDVIKGLPPTVQVSHVANVEQVSHAANVVQVSHAATAEQVHLWPYINSWNR